MNLPANYTDTSWADAALRARLNHRISDVLKEFGLNIPENTPAEVAHQLVRIHGLMWVNGQIIRRDQFHIDPMDEGLLFGRGLWESTTTLHGKPWLWEKHMNRLLMTAQLVGIALAPELLPTSDQVRQFVRSLTSMEVVVRLNVSAGSQTRPGLVWMTAALPPKPLPNMRLRSARLPIEKGQPYLTWKTFQYATRLQVGKQAFQAGFDSALLLDGEDHVLEAAHANIFIRIGNEWLTPLAEEGGLLPGTVRALLLEKQPVPIRQARIPYSQLHQAEEIFVTNSNIGLVPVTQIDSLQFPIGETTGKLLHWFSQSA